MITALMRVSWISLRRDRAAQMLAFVVPVAFFSIFAIIFGGHAGDGGSRRTGLLVVDESHTPMSRALLKGLQGESALRVVTGAVPAGSAAHTPELPFVRAQAESLVKAGEESVALVFPAGIDTSIARFDGRGVKSLLLADPADPIAPRVVEGELQYASLVAGSAVAAEAGLGVADTGGPLRQRAARMMPAPIEQQNVLGEKHSNGMVAFYAAGIAVMFLMFSASASGGALLEETESGTLERVLNSGLGMTRLLAAKWGYIALRGALQVVIMFVWGMLVFHLPLMSHLPGFVVMTAFTSMCAASFGLAIATASRTRQQLQGMTNLIVLSLSAIGGSMFPRFLMSESLQRISLVGFNAWALDGYLKVFWHEAPLLALWPQVLALVGFTVLFFALARRFAMRWELA